LAFLLAVKYTHGVFPPTVSSALVGFQILLAALMISGFYISKLVSRKTKFFNWFQVSCVVVGYVFGLAMVFPEVLCSMIAVYTSIGFVYGLLKRAEIRESIEPVEAH
jgi:hypothetical protein